MWFEIFFIVMVVIGAICVGIVLLLKLAIMVGLMRGLWTKDEGQQRYDPIAAQRAWEDYMKYRYDTFILENSDGKEKQP